MSSNCVECGKEFVPFVTGHNLYCNDCHSEIVNGLNKTSSSNDSASQKKNKSSSNNDKISSDRPFNEEEFIAHEKYYHSMKFHKKFEK